MTAGSNEFESTGGEESSDMRDEDLSADGSATHGGSTNELATLEQQVRELTDRNLRLLADFENQRKRFERERIDVQKFATESLVKDLLAVLDGFDTALTQTTAATAQEAPDVAEKVTKYVQGFELIHRQLVEVLKKSGLESIEGEGVAFDPNIHQAIQMIPQEGVNTETVSKVFAKGYLLNGRVVRAAMVSVSAPM